MSTLWDQLPGESAKAFSAFCTYLDLGPRRSLDEASRSYHHEPGRQTPRSDASRLPRASGTIRRWAHQWNWQARSRAWDQEAERIKRTQRQAALQEMTERHTREAIMLQNKAVERLRLLRPDELNSRELLAFLVQSAKLERIAQGEPDSSVAQEHNLQDPKELTDEELARIVTSARGTYYLQAAEELQRRRAARKNLHEFVRQAWHLVEPSPFVDSWHVGAICEHLQAVTAGQIQKLLINIPPGAGKSLLTSVFWPTWEWSSNPAVRWLFASYDARLSTRDSVKCRALLSSRWYQLRCDQKFELKEDQNQKTYFETDRGGYRLATSTGGHGTGEHPDRIICDDPHNVRQAESPAERRALLQWWGLTMSTRGVARNARRVLVMQRLHANDLSAHVLAEGGWEHLCLPMRFERVPTAATILGWSDPRTKDGDLLCPRLFDEGQVCSMEKSLGSYGAAGQLQQRPVPRAGGMFQRDWFTQFVDASPAPARRVRYWDRAATAGGGCYTCGVLLARTDDARYYVENIVRGQWSSRQRDQVMLQTAQADRAKYGELQPYIFIEREGGSSGKDSVCATAQLFDGFPISSDLPTGSKEARAEPFAAQCEAGNVFLVRGPWNEEYIEELCLFPMGTYSDQVDASSGAHNRLAQGAYGSRIYGDLITSARLPAQDFDPVEVYNVFGIDVVFDDRDENEWWRL
jgi:predicted phage terminase large subunit-like protein